MKIQSNNKKNRILTITYTVIVLLFLGAGIYAYITIVNKSSETNETSTNQEFRPVGEVDYSAPKKDESNPTLDTTEDPAKTPQPESSSPIPVTITSAGGDPLQIRVLISELLQTGSCTVTLEKAGSANISQTVEIFNSASSTTCKGFMIETSNIAKGTWKITITVSSDNRIGRTSQEITL